MGNPGTARNDEKKQFVINSKKSGEIKWNII